MKKLFHILTSVCALGVGLMSLSPAAIARDRIDWSVSIGSGGYAPPPVVYAPPPVIYAPPRVVHAPPPVVYQRVVPVVQYGPHPSYWREHRRHKHHRHHYHRHHYHHYGY